MLAKMTCMVMLAMILLFSPSMATTAKETSPSCPKGYCKGSIAYCLPNAEDACGVYDGCATGLSQSSAVVIKLEVNIASVEDCNAMCLTSLADNGEECYFFSYSYGRSVSTSNRGQCRIHRKPMDGLDLKPDHWPGFISCPVTPYPIATTTASPDPTTTPWTSTWTVVPGEGVCDSGYLDGDETRPQVGCQEGCEANDQCKYYCYGTESLAWDCLRYSKCDGRKTIITEHNLDVKDYTCFEKPQAPTKEPITTTAEPPIQALCPQYGADNSKCHTSDTNEIGVHMQKDCQAAAVAAGHKYYSWNENDELCATSASCDIANLGHEWKIYSCESTATEPPTTTKATTTEPPSTTTEPPVQATTSTPTAIQQCRQWCAGDSHAWSTKCKWKNCRRCGECESVEAPAGCEAWCAGNSNAWSTKCKWTNCKRCDKCSAIEEPTGCKSWCAGNSNAWSTKCTWKNCRTCDECKSAEKPESCKNWCAGNSRPWSAKCTWKHCKRCSECEENRRLQSSSQLLSASQSTILV